MSNYLDFLDEKDDDSIKDLVLVANSNHIREWIDKLNFMKLNFVIITNKQFQHENVIITTKNINSKGFWKGVYNKFKAFNYLIVGQEDTPVNFDIMYLEFLNSRDFIWINDSQMYNLYNSKFQNINKYIDKAVNKYIMFKNNYLKFILNVKGNRKTFRHSLVYYRNKYPKEIKSKIVEYIGVNTKITGKDKREKFFINLKKIKFVFIVPIFILFNIWIALNMNDIFETVFAGSMILLLFIFLIDMYVFKEKY